MARLTGVEPHAGCFTLGSHTYLAGILRKCIMGNKPGIPLGPHNQSTACGSALEGLS